MRLAMTLSLWAICISSSLDVRADTPDVKIYTAREIVSVKQDREPPTFRHLPSEGWLEVRARGENTFEVNSDSFPPTVMRAGMFPRGENPGLLILTAVRANRGRRAELLIGPAGHAIWEDPPAKRKIYRGEVDPEFAARAFSKDPVGIPWHRRYPVERIRDACHRWFDSVTQRSSRR